jgi:CubicO group peptidase (beta-lactamase class C family)
MIQDKKPEEEGISSENLLELIDKIDQDRDMEMHSLQVLRHGFRILNCNWKPYASEIPHAMFSLTKTLTALATGFALDDNLFSLDDKVVSFFPEYADEFMDEKMKDVKIRDLLTMRSGYFENLSGCGYLSQIHENLIRKFLRLPLTYQPGEKFVYNSANTHMVSCIISKVTGMPEQMYLAKRLFEPLNIGPIQWDTDEYGNSTGSWGSYLSADEMAVIGQFMLQRGVWEGKRILSDSWFDLMSYHYVDVGDNREGYFYGYQVWSPGDNSYMADGAFGQIIYIIPDYDSVLVMTRGMANTGNDKMIGNSRERGWIYTSVFNKAADKPLPMNEDANNRLQNKIDNEYLSIRDYGIEPNVFQFQKAYYSMDSNFDGIKGIELEFWKNEIVFSIYDQTGIHRIPCGKGSWKTSYADIPGKELHHNREFDAMKMGARASWMNQKTLEISMAFLNLQSVDTIVCEMTENKLIYKRSVRFNGQGLPIKKTNLCGTRRKF